MSANCRLVPVARMREDARLIMEWRNDPSTRVMFFHDEEKSWPEFWDEFQNYYFDPDLPPPQFLHCDGQPVAFIRFEPTRGEDAGEPDAIGIGINVAHEQRQKGFGLAALHRAEGFLGGLGYRRILALVKIENTASLKLFRAAGYEDTGRVSIDVDGLPDPVPVVRFYRGIQGN